MVKGTSDDMRETKLEKSKRLDVEVLKVVETGTIYEVEGGTRKHTVIKNKLRKNITCDCRYFALHPNQDCSHVLAVKRFLGEC